MKISVLLLIFTVIISSGVYARSAYKIEGNDVIIELDGYGAKSKLLKIEIWSPRTIKVISTMNDEFAADPRFIGERDSEIIKYKVAYAQSHIEITTSQLLINVAEDGLVRLLSRDGKKLLVESDRTFELSEKEKESYRVTQRFFLNRHEYIYDFGQNENNPFFTIRGQSFDLVQDNASIASPIFISEKGYAFYWDNYSDTHFSDAPSGLTINSEVADEIRFFFTYGPDWSSIISEIRAISGKAKLLPRWAYGFHLNPAEYETSDALNSAINRYKTFGVPVESVVVDHQLLVEEKKINNEKHDSRIANVAAFLQLENKYSELEKNTSTERLAIPTHVNLPGIQQYGTFTVAGDLKTSWQTLNTQVGSGINSSLTGQPYWSTSLGGVIDDEELSSASKSELLVRWYQFAAFTPVFQGAVGNKEIWNVGQKGDKSFDAIVKSIQLRYQLLPYIYSTASTVVFNHETMLRSLLFDFQNDESVYDIDQQFMFGKALMVCPVTTQGAEKVEVYLPAETKWFDFWSGKLFEGGQKITVEATLDHIPLFVRQGSILPFETDLNSADNLPGTLEIRIYKGEDAEFTLYEDENDGVGYLFGQCSKIKFEYSQKSKTLTIASIEGGYQGVIDDRVFNIVLVSEADGMGINASSTVTPVEYKGKKIKLKL
jgi:alpha-glucosidase (family GH31 glycosyl hydrolase)